MAVEDMNESLTVDQKFAKALLALRELSPFYAAVYEVMEKIETKTTQTAGVTTNKFVYNREFIDKTSFDELIFIFMHEIAHIALMHVSRRENRDPTLWNIACDLYVNSLVAYEVRISEPGMTDMCSNYRIKFPENCCFTNSIDLDKDCVEDIYDCLDKQARNNGYYTAKISDMIMGKTFKFTYKGKRDCSSAPSTSSFFTRNVISMSSKYDIFEANIDPSKVENDLKDDGSDQNLKEQESRKIVSDATVRVDMSDRHAGTEAGGLEVLAKNMLKSELSWKKLLKRYLIHATSHDSSFSNPDKRMCYQKCIYPGQVEDELNEIHGVKVCIDTSGSISDEDIAYFCGQVYSLTKQFKIKAEIIYWDASVQSTGEFTGYKEFQRVICTGRGGTRPEVVFEYLDSKKCKIKPIVTLMFTDAFFSGNWATPAMKKKFKDTIWIMTRDYDPDFKPPFGKKAIAKFN